MEYILIGNIVNTFGIKGELKIRLLTDFVEERFKEGSTVYVGENRQPFICNEYKIHKGFLIISFKDNEDINLVEKFKNSDVYKSSDDIKPLKDDYYFRDLKGLDVSFDNKVIGKVLYMEEGVRSNYLRVLSDTKQVLIPYMDHFIDEVNLEKKYIKVKNIEGLL